MVRRMAGAGARVAPECVTALPGTLDGAVDGLAQCDLRAGMAFVAEGGDRMTFHCVLAGNAHAAVDDQVSMDLPCGTALLLPAACAIRLSSEHAATRRSRRPDARVMIGRVSPRAAVTLGLAGLREPLVYDLSNVPGATALAGALVEELDAPTLGTIPLLSALMKLGLVYAARDLKLDTQVAGSRVSEAVSAVLTDPGAPHSIGSLADLVRMSRATFIRHFAQLTGTNPMRFVSHARMEHAAELLRSTDLPLKVIAARIGFANRSHFSRAFRRKHGIDPSSFRKSLPVAPE